MTDLWRLNHWVYSQMKDQEPRCTGEIVEYDRDNRPNWRPLCWPIEGPIDVVDPRRHFRRHPLDFAGKQRRLLLESAEQSVGLGISLPGIEQFDRAADARRAWIAEIDGFEIVLQRGRFGPADLVSGRSRATRPTNRAEPAGGFEMLGRFVSNAAVAGFATGISPLVRNARRALPLPTCEFLDDLLQAGRIAIAQRQIEEKQPCREVFRIGIATAGQTRACAVRPSFER